MGGGTLDGKHQSRGERTVLRGKDWRESNKKRSPGWF